MTHLSEIEQASFGNHESGGHRCILKHGLSTCGSLDPEAAAAPLCPFGDYGGYSGGTSTFASEASPYWLSLSMTGSQARSRREHGATV